MISLMCCTIRLIATTQDKIQCKMNVLKVLPSFSAPLGIMTSAYFFVYINRTLNVNISSNNSILTGNVNSSKAGLTKVVY